jgi:hypothetical protein
MVNIDFNRIHQDLLPAVASTYREDKHIKLKIHAFTSETQSSRTSCTSLVSNEHDGTEQQTVMKLLSIIFLEHMSLHDMRLTYRSYRRTSVTYLTARLYF